MHADLNKKEGNTNILKTMALRLQTKEKPLLINKIFCFKQKALKNKDMYDVRMYYLIDSANTSILNNNVNNNVNNVNTKIKLNLDDDRHIFIQNNNGDLLTPEKLNDLGIRMHDKINYVDHLYNLSFVNHEDEKYYKDNEYYTENSNFDIVVLDENYETYKKFSLIPLSNERIKSLSKTTEQLDEEFDFIDIN